MPAARSPAQCERKMALGQWNIEPATRRCTDSGAVLAEGEEFYAVLFEDGESFRREEYSLEAWTGPPEGAFCHFKSRVPVKEKKRRLLVDDDMLIHFFVRLADAEDDAKRRFRFVLALILMRKRLLKFEQTYRKDEGEWWEMRLAREPADGDASKDDVHRVLNPHLDDEQIETVSKELGAILHGQTPDEGEAADGSEPSSVPEVCDE